MKIKAKSVFERHKPVVHGGLLSKNTPLSGVLDFSSNVNPMGMPKKTKSILRKHIEKINDYPDIHSTKLITALSHHLNIPETNLLVGNGAIEIIYNFCNAFLSKNTPVLIPIPTFAEYEVASKLNNAKVLFYKTMNLSNNLSQFISKIPKNGCIFICNPNNPTGKLIPKKDLLKIIHISKKKNCLVFIDECFIELVPESNQSVVSNVTKFDNLIVLRSLTKSFGLAGIRIGYAASSKYIASILKKTKIPWSVNIMSQYAAIHSLNDKSHLSRTNFLIKKEYDFLKKNISKIKGFEFIDSSTNFILIKTKQDSTKLQKKLLDKKILVRDCTNFPGLNNHFIRIAIRSHKDNLKLVNALEMLK
jgi:threonine-phosphate decarboxylase